VQEELGIFFSAPKFIFSSFVGIYSCEDNRKVGIYKKRCTLAVVVKAVMRKGRDGGKCVLVLAVPTAPSDHLLHY
jgi:hypothetical protein